ncbi:MBL fold metallo-hydrolase [Treponema sp.]|uniref:MBL fold metallo-hydrolase n=1 Tax=Treponema sp. TaxID=166 RepID=UPI003F083AF7
MSINENSFLRLSPHVGMFCHSTNIGVVFSGNEIFLIDSGQSEEDGKFIAETLQVLFPGKKIKAVIHTHSHADHCGGSLYLKKNCGAQLWASAEAARIMEIPALTGAIYCGGALLKEFDIPQFTPQPIFSDRILGEETIMADDVSMTFYFLPGHFFGQIGILVRDISCGTLSFFLGDSFFGAELLNKTWIPFLCNQKEFRQSVRKIASIKSDFYIPGHGSKCTLEAINALAEINIMVTYEFESLILKKIREGFCTTELLLKAVADYSSIKMKVVPFYLIGATLRSYLSCMEHEGKIRCEIIDNKLFWRI